MKLRGEFEGGAGTVCAEGAGDAVEVAFAVEDYSQRKPSVGAHELVDQSELPPAVALRRELVNDAACQRAAVALSHAAL